MFSAFIDNVSNSKVTVESLGNENESNNSMANSCSVNHIQHELQEIKTVNDSTVNNCAMNRIRRRTLLELRTLSDLIPNLQTVEELVAPAV